MSKKKIPFKTFMNKYGPMMGAIAGVWAIYEIVTKITSSLSQELNIVLPLVGLAAVLFFFWLTIKNSEFAGTFLCVSAFVLVTCFQHWVWAGIAIEKRTEGEDVVMVSMAYMAAKATVMITGVTVMMWLALFVRQTNLWIMASGALIREMAKELPDETRKRIWQTVTDKMKDEWHEPENIPEF